MLVWELEKYMEEQTVSKTRLAELLQTSRTGLDRILDEKNLSITLNTMVNVARLTGKKCNCVLARNYHLKLFSYISYRIFVGQRLDDYSTKLLVGGSGSCRYSLVHNFLH